MRIYALMWGELVLYVGKTIQSLNQRVIAHRCQTNDTWSKYIPDYMDWEIVLVDQVPDEEGTKWEQYYYDELMPLYNHQRPGQTHCESSKAHYHSNKEAYAERHRAYRQANRERINQRRRNLRAIR